MAELKTQKNDASVETFLNSIEPEQKRQDAFTILDLMRNVTGSEPTMWGPSIIGFGNLHYRYASGREGDWFQAGFSPRKANLTLYLPGGLEIHADLLAQFGKHTSGKGCIYVKKLADVQLDVLKQMLERSIASDGIG